MFLDFFLIQGLRRYLVTCKKCTKSDGYHSNCTNTIDKSITGSNGDTGSRGGALVVVSVALLLALLVKKKLKKVKTIFFQLIHIFFCLYPLLLVF